MNVHLSALQAQFFVCATPFQWFRQGSVLCLCHHLSKMSARRILCLYLSLSLLFQTSCSIVRYIVKRSRVFANQTLASLRFRLLWYTSNYSNTFQITSTNFRLSRWRDAILRCNFISCLRWLGCLPPCPRRRSCAATSGQ